MYHYDTPINYLINSHFSPIVHFYDEQENRFFVGDSSLKNREEILPCVHRLPYLEEHFEFIDSIFFRILTIEEYCFWEENFDDCESIYEFAERTHLKQKYVEATEIAIPYIFENWSRENYLDIDWELATFA